MKRTVLAVLLLLAGACQKANEKPAVPYTDLRLTELTRDEQLDTERLLAEAFADALSKTPATAPTAEKVIRLHWWVHTHLYQVDPEPPISILKVLRERRGQCGASSYVFQMLVSRLKLKTRSLGLFCIPRQNGHVGAEVFYDDSWHFFDSSFGVFFTLNGRIDGPVASLGDLLAFPGLVKTNIFYPVSYGRLGWNYPPMKPMALTEMFKRTQPAYEVTWGDYVLFTENACGAIVYQTGARIELPYRLSLASTPRHELGTLDGSFNDISLHYTGDRMYDATGQYVLGDDSSSLGPLIINHRYVISGTQRGDTVRVTLFRLSGASAHTYRFRAFGGVIDQIEYYEDLATVTMHARAKTVELKSWTDGDARSYLDAVTFERIPPEPAAGD